MNYRVSEVAKLSGVTVRTLHHYDELGLVPAQKRSFAGYRLYDDDGLERLQSVLFYRELGFSLSDIADLVAAPGFSRRLALIDQHAMLGMKRDHLDRMLKSVEAALIADEQGVTMSKEDLLSPFGDFDLSQYAQEAEERWGNTGAYKESMRRTSEYTADDWHEVTAEAEGVAEAFAQLVRAGTSPESPQALAVAERHRRHIEDRFYPCSHEMHSNLGEMYVADHRFTEYWDKRVEGLAGFVRDAITANAISQM